MNAPMPTEMDSIASPAKPRGRQALRMLVISLVVTVASLVAYDHFVARPARRLGVVDLAAIFRAEEDEYTRVFYKAAAANGAGATGAAPAGAGPTPAQLAQDFAQRLPLALNELSRECRCVIVVRGAVATLGEGMVDLTPALRGKLGMRP